MTHLTGAKHSILQADPGDNEIFLSKFVIFPDAFLKALQEELWNIARVNSTYVYLYKKLQAYWSIRAQEFEASSIYKQSTHEGGKVVSPRHRPFLPLRYIPGAHFCYRHNWPQGRIAAGRNK
jgi:hypothetical protein